YVSQMETARSKSPFRTKAMASIQPRCPTSSTVSIAEIPHARAPPEAPVLASPSAKAQSKKPAAPSRLKANPHAAQPQPCGCPSAPHSAARMHVFAYWVPYPCAARVGMHEPPFLL